jgi:phosphatidylserine decarboxylase
MTRRSWQEAWRYVVTAGALGALLLLVGRRTGWLAIGAAGLFVLFFRDPERRLDPDPRVVYAAADGVVTAIEESVRDEWMPDKRALRITTFLNLHNVHVNRSPVVGEVTQVESVRGGFAPALWARSGDNTRRRVAIDGAGGRVVVVQVAGLLARRISGWVQQGERVVAGQRLGMIHLGSRTDVLLPPGSVEVLVTPGARVRAGISELARYRARVTTSATS